MICIIFTVQTLWRIKLFLQIIIEIHIYCRTRILPIFPIKQCFKVQIEFHLWSTQVINEYHTDKPLVLVWIKVKWGRRLKKEGLWSQRDSLCYLQSVGLFILFNFYRTLIFLPANGDNKTHSSGRVLVYNICKMLSVGTL